MDSVWNFTFGATGTLKDEVSAENTPTLLKWQVSSNDVIWLKPMI